jgi:spermidine/putrescine transport system ATP-binding protein
MTEPKTLLELRSVSKSYGATSVLKRIDLEVLDGEFITLLGPSGSGKTTILRLIGGFTSPSDGEILLDGRNIAPTPINKRPFNTVFQDYALFPHLTVAGNVGYGLAVRGVRKSEIEARVRDALELVQLDGFGERHPAQLSGGQRQRVALARAIICRPRLILLDEPLAALDVALRRQMQSFLKSIQTEIKTTFLFVTHDQEEAIAMADRICVMNDGMIQQIGAPRDVYYRPKSEFVARFFGDNNLLPGRLGPSRQSLRDVETAIGPIACSIDGQPELASLPDGSRVLAACRPEAIAFDGTDGTRVPATITEVSFGGASTVAACMVHADKSTVLRARVASRAQETRLDPGREVTLCLPKEACRVVPL